ncbi:MAG TPA: low-specificity L-threonine aldolase [Deltaproteobacteria bacterium]|nr:low-specificity L-threonine aldolase [Deltaproteobacteria bacterium]
MIDLRSDTVTKPIPAMRQVMAEAEVGDDVFGDDPTVNALETRTAEILGMESAVFMPSGTMTNQVAVRTHTESGDEIFLADNAHIYLNEGGGASALSGVSCNLLPNERGVFDGKTLEQAIRPSDVHFPQPKLVCVENTSNLGFGRIWPLQTLADVSECARERGLRMHLDGARLWNASVASGTPEAEITKHFDSVSVCFSKGLGAPVGSALAGSKEFVARARRFRKQFGGAMRQAGIIAAGALYALDFQHDRLADDHKNARTLAEGLSRLDGVSINLESVETNLVYFGLERMATNELVERLNEREVLMLSAGPGVIRAVPNLMVDADMTQIVLGHIKEILEG